MRLHFFFALLLLALLRADRDAEWARRLARKRMSEPELPRATDDLDLYHTPEQSAQLIRATVASGAVPSSVVTVGNSTHGREVLGIRFATCAGGTCDDKPNVVYYGPVHGDERVGGELLYRLVAHIRDHYHTHAVQSLLAACNLIVVPHPNPDGFHMLQRYLVGDIDMNRAFYPDRCNTDNPYAAAGAVAEVEQTKAFFLAEQPIGALLMHGGAQVVSYPYDDECEHHGTNRESLAPDHLLYTQMAKNYSRANPMMSRFAGVFPDGITNGAYWYSLSGGLQDWTLVHVPSMVVPLTVEVSNQKMPAYGEITRRFWAANFPALMVWPAALRQGVWGAVAMLDGSSPAGATAYVFPPTGRRTVADQHGKPVPVRADGRFFRPLATGTWEVCVTKPMYSSACARVTVHVGQNTEVAIEMRLDV